MADDKTLSRLREKIDQFDVELLDTLSERMKVADEIGDYKRENNTEVRDEKRRSEVVSDRVARGKSRGLSGEMVRKIFDVIIDESESRQK